MHGERFMNGERERTGAESAKLWTHSERKVSALWTHAERTVSERKNGKVGRFRGYTYIYVNVKICTYRIAIFALGVNNIKYQDSCIYMY